MKRSATLLAEELRSQPHIFGGTGLSCHSIIALCLIGLLITPGPLLAQQVPGQAAKPAAAEAAGPQRNAVQGKLKILVLEGQNAVNSLTSKTAVSPVVQILDVMEQPVEGASVTFEVSPTGPGGLFGNAPIATVRTDYTGQATATLTPNNTPGAFSIKVTASLGNETAEARIRQSNDRKVTEAMIPVPPKPWFKNWKWWAVIGAGAGAGIATAVILSNRGDKSTITLSPGPIVIGGPN